jgi:short-subunit dehydrogenase
VALTSRSKEKLAPLLKELTDSGADAKSFELDIASTDSIISAFKAIKEAFKSPLRVAVANAAPGFSMGPFLQIQGSVFVTAQMLPD